jgi:poly-gamma-glutamate capsule biosynthesis protein CapA/YwtB (metallophosphatase superfamily)
VFFNFSQYYINFYRHTFPLTFNNFQKKVKNKNLKTNKKTTPQVLDRAKSVSTMLTKTANTPIKPWQLLPKFGKLATIEKRKAEFSYKMACK